VASPQVFEMVVRQGIKANMGMPAYQDLTDDDLTALRHFIQAKAREAGEKNELRTNGI
jgi:hypothetical protein